MITLVKLTKRDSLVERDGEERSCFGFDNVAFVYAGPSEYRMRFVVMQFSDWVGASPVRWRSVVD